jgi:hypothetical protein
MAEIDKLEAIAKAAPVSNGWFVLTRSNNGSDVRARHATGGSTWIAECRTNADAAHIATFSPERVLALLAVVRAARELDALIESGVGPVSRESASLHCALAAFDALEKP